MAVKTNKKALEVPFLKSRIAKINKVLGKFENEVERAVAKFMKRGEKSSQVLRKNFDEIIDKIASSDIYSRANEKGEEWLREFKRLADEVVGKLKDFDVRFAQPLLKEVRMSLDEFISKLQHVDLVEKAKDKVVNTRNHLLTVLSIPTQKDVDDLSQKVSRLEKKIKTVTERQAA